MQYGQADKGDDGVLIKDTACWSIQTMTEAGNNRGGSRKEHESSEAGVGGGFLSLCKQRRVLRKEKKRPVLCGARMLTLVRSLAGDEKKHLSMLRLNWAHLDIFRRSKLCPFITCFRRITRCEVQPAQILSQASLLVRDLETIKS